VTSTPPPGHLSKASKAWFRLITADFRLEEWQLRTLTAAAESWDRMTQARELVAAEGITVDDRFGVAKVHPAVAVERDSRLSFLRCVRELALEVDDEPAEVRPPRIRAVR